MSDMDISKRAVAEHTIILNPGRMLDNNNAHLMVAAISQAQEENYKFIIISMDSLEFLSSAGVGSILSTIENVRESDGDIILCNASDTILHVLEVLDLTDYLTIKHDEVEARALCEVKDRQV